MESSNPLCNVGELHNAARNILLLIINSKFSEIAKERLKGGRYKRDASLYSYYGIHSLYC